MKESETWKGGRSGEKTSRRWHSLSFLTLDAQHDHHDADDDDDADAAADDDADADADYDADADAGTGAHAQNMPIKDDVHSVTKHFWESNVAQGNENECRFNQILFYMTLPLLISCVCYRMCPSLFGNF